MGRTRTTVVSPDLSVITMAAVISSSDPGAGSLRSDRKDYSWPNVMTFVQEAVNIAIPKADGNNATDGYLDDFADLWLASVLANTAPEENPGQVGEPYSTLLAGIADFQSNLSIKLGMAEYIALKAAGVCGLRDDVEDGWVFQSGVTTSLTSGLEPISRRRMADFLQDSMARAANRHAKKKGTQARKDAVMTELVTFLDGLVSAGNPDAARIADFSMDDKSGNTPALTASNIYVIQSKVKLLGDLGTIVLQTDIGASVIVTRVVS